MGRGKWVYGGYGPVGDLTVVMLGDQRGIIPCSAPLQAASPMSFQDVEAGLSRPSVISSPQSKEDSAFLGLQSSLSLQVFKINSNVQGILKLVDQLGTAKDSAALRKSL